MTTGLKKSLTTDIPIMENIPCSTLYVGFVFIFNFAFDVEKITTRIQIYFTLKREIKLQKKNSAQKDTANKKLKEKISAFIIKWVVCLCSLSIVIYTQFIKNLKIGLIDFVVYFFFV
jgi:hypothetical protein